jgi:hypothetical protein
VKHGSLFILISAVTAVALVILGFLWQAHDINRVIALDYHKYSQNIASYGGYTDPKDKIIMLKDSLSQYMHIIKEYQVDKSIWELLGQDNRVWLFSSYLHKFTVIDAMVRPKDRSAAPTRQLLVFALYVPTGAMPLAAMALFFLITIPAVFMKRANFPHIYPEAHPVAAPPDTKPARDKGRPR